MITEVTNLLLEVFGVVFLIYLIYKGSLWLWNKRPRITLKNPLKEYIRKQVLEYLKELQNEK